MCYITATEFKKNLGHYMELSKTENIVVTKNKKVVTVLINDESYKLLLLEQAKGSFGKMDNDIDYDELLKQEIFAKCGF